MAQDQFLARNIAGEVAISDKPSETLKKWRQIFGINQGELAKNLQVSPSVVSDYESGRRRSPGVGFIKKYVETLIQIDSEAGGELTQTLSSSQGSNAILDLRELLTPVKANKLIKAVDGVIIGKEKIKGELNGYTIIDSIQAILTLTDKDLIQIYGATPSRALIFTKVSYGRSPMIAIKVTKPKPSMVVLHGVKPSQVDSLAVKIAKIEGIPLIVSKINTEEELIDNLRNKLG